MRGVAQEMAKRQKKKKKVMLNIKVNFKVLILHCCLYKSKKYTKENMYRLRIHTFRVEYYNMEGEESGKWLLPKRKEEE